MPNITYMPHPHDADDTEVAGVRFSAYVPVDVKNADLFVTLRRNPFFTDGVPDPVRKKQWETSRKAHAHAKRLRNEADAVEKNPDLVDFAAGNAHGSRH